MSAQLVYIPHGGGPLPLMGDASHQKLIHFLKNLATDLEKPDAIIVISAHWEATGATITSNPAPALIYDYSGFPKETYLYQYPVQGQPQLAADLFDALTKANIIAAQDAGRGFDHGLFVPLKIMFPEADIPCIQLSLVNTLDAATHINIGKALALLKYKNILMVGSGFSFHNMAAFMRPSDATDIQNDLFQNWLIDICTSNTITEETRELALINWKTAPAARYCHPREEHLLPLHVCYGIAQSAAQLIFDDTILGKRACGFSWHI